MPSKKCRDCDNAVEHGKRLCKGCKENRREDVIEFNKASYVSKMKAKRDAAREQEKKNASGHRKGGFDEPNDPRID